jgi:hypothetical protein
MRFQTLSEQRLSRHATGDNRDDTVAFECRAKAEQGVEHRPMHSRTVLTAKSTRDYKFRPPAASGG